MADAELLIPRPRRLADSPRLRWGLLGAGGIGALFVDAIHAYSNQRFCAVAARSAERAERFARQHGIARAYDSYEALVVDPGVDVVYVAAIHNAHADLALLAISAGKHVLVEKPFATTRNEAQHVADAARAAGVFAMEAMWTRYIPQADVIAQVLESGTIGAVRMVTADFGFSVPVDSAHRLFDPNQAGGALMDAGVYPVSFASSVLGPPVSVTAVGQTASTGVDSEVALVLTHKDAHSMALTALTACLPVRAAIMGTNGRIDVHAPFFGPSGITLTTGNFLEPGRQSVHWEDRTLPALHDGLSYEADAFARFVSEGRIESPVHTLEETVAIVAILDDARQQVLGG
jgi:predicted dehydrogenase